MSKKSLLSLLIGSIVLSLLTAYEAPGVWASETAYITLNGDSITVAGEGVVVDGSRATIVAPGRYSLSGHLADGQIIVNTEETETVELILSGVNINSSTSAPINIEKAQEAIIVLEANTENYMSDGPVYSLDEGADEPNAAIFSKADLTISGGGTLTVIGNYNDGIASKDGLTITSGTLVVSAVDDGLRGKDYLIIKDGQITVSAQGDGLKSDNEDDATLGYVAVDAGTINVTASGDAIQAQTNVVIAGGSFNLVSGGGSNWIDETLSAKGIKATASIMINGGVFTVNSADDALHSNDSIVINGGTFNITTGDDGVHADSSLEVNGGDVKIIHSYEGIESAVITINNGTLFITASDDGLNVAGGNDGSGTMAMPGQGGRPGRGGGPGQEAFAATGNYHLYINGGHIVIDAAGDGIDSNGTIEMTNGIVLVHGPTEQMNGALDHAGFTVTGGYLVAVGSAGMAQSPDESSSQYSLLLNLNATLPAGTLIHIQDGAGNDVLTFAPAKEYQSIAFSSSGLVAGTSYTVYYGGSSSGAVDNGLYQGGTYTPGTLYTDFTINSVVTLIGKAGRW